MKRRDWLATARHVLPHLRGTVAAMRPTLHRDTAATITPGFLADLGIRGLIWDVDGTLTEYHATALASGVRDAAELLFARDDLCHAILSNCDEWRFDELKEIFPGLPLIRAYQKDDEIIRRTSIGAHDTHPSAAVESLLTSGARQIRKPSAALIDHAVAILGVGSDACAMIGDQYMTDVASANLAGIRSIKVRTLARHTFPATLRATQRLEDLLYRVRYGAPGQRS